MRKLQNGWLVVEMVVLPEEKSTVKTMIIASGKSESSFLREMCGLEPKMRGAPVGNKNRKGKKSATNKKPLFSK